MLAQLASRGLWHLAKHLAYLDQKLSDLAARRIKRLIVTLPPRHGKSQLCSRYFPAWYLGTHPNDRVILCSYEANFAAEWGGRARDVLEEYGHDLFGVSVRHDSSARDDWKISGREGGMVTAGVGGPITGRGANLLIIDDPVKNAAEAHSPTYRERVWSWWLSTALTRVEPDGVVLLVMTRWHEDDLAGRLIAQDKQTEGEDGEQWEVVNLPAIAEASDELGREVGAALWDERWPLAKLLARMRKLGLYVWNALFQQRPAPPEGNYFKREWFDKIVAPDRVPNLVRVCRAWDLAATEQVGSNDPDWLVGTKIGKSESGDYFILHVCRARTTPEGAEATIKQFAASDGHECMIRIEQEGAASGKIVASHFTRMLDGYNVAFTGIPRTSKLVRAGPFNAACERRQVKLVEGAWIGPWIEEVVTFPTGTHDDQVDSAAAAYTSIANVLEIEATDATPVAVW